MLDYAKRNPLRNDVRGNESAVVMNSQKEMNVHMHTPEESWKTALSQNVFDWINVSLVMLFVVYLITHNQLTNDFPGMNFILFGYVSVMVFVKLRIIKF